MVKLLHLSEIHYLNDAQECYAFLRKESLHKFDLLLITGITENGDPDEFIRLSILVEELMQLFEIKPEQVLIQPSREDLKQDITTFCTLFFQRLIGQPYASNTITSIEKGLVQICSLPTATNADVQWSVDQLYQLPLGANALRVVIHHEPPYMWSSIDQLEILFHISLHGGVKSRLYNQDWLAVGINHGLINFLDIDGVGRMAKFTECSYVHKRWWISTQDTIPIRKITQTKPPPAWEEASYHISAQHHEGLCLEAYCKKNTLDKNWFKQWSRWFDELWEELMMPLIPTVRYSTGMILGIAIMRGVFKGQDASHLLYQQVRIFLERVELTSLECLNPHLPGSASTYIATGEDWQDALRTYLNRVDA